MIKYNIILNIRDSLVFSMKDWKQKAKAKILMENKNINKNITIKGILVNNNKNILEIIIESKNDMIINCIKYDKK